MGLLFQQMAMSYKLKAVQQRISGLKRVPIAILMYYLRSQQKALIPLFLLFILTFSETRLELPLE